MTGQDGEPWFVAKDVCDVLGLAHTSSAIRDLDDDEKTTMQITHSGSNYKSKISIVNEPGLYALIGQSRKPQAKAFRKWAHHEVFPQIRKTGVEYAQVAHIHDEYQFIVKEDLAEQLGEISRQAIVSAGEFFKFRCPLDGEYKIGSNWAETH
ncbi:MAG: BRO family protein [Desulfovibrionaceae bacterium]